MDMDKMMLSADLMFYIDPDKVIVELEKYLPALFLAFLLSECCKEGC